MIHTIDEWKASKLDTASRSICGEVISNANDKEFFGILSSLLLKPGDRLLEIGFGLGLSASVFRNVQLRTHDIWEIHPEIIRHAFLFSLENENTQVLECSWMDLRKITPTIAYDCVYFDAFSNIFNEDLLFLEFIRYASKNLLNDNGRFSFFTQKKELPDSIMLALRECFVTVDIVKIANINHLIPVASLPRNGIDLK